jgi:type I restriction enzyme S subunit
MLAETIIETLPLTDEEKPLPEGWRWKRLRDVCYAVRGITFSSDEARVIPFENSIACLTTSGVQHVVAWDSRCYIPKQRVKASEQLLRENDLLVSTANSKALVGKSCLVSALPYDCTFGAFVTVLRASDKIEPYLLDSWLRSPIAKKYCYNKSSNTTNISNLRIEDLLDLEIPLPQTIEEQRRIASILDGQMKAVEQARLAVEAQLATANLTPNAFLRSAFESEEQQNWQKRKLGELLNLRKEVVHPRNNPRGEALFVGLEHIQSSTGKRIGVIEVKKEQLTGRKPQFYKGDLVYGYLRPYLNKLWVAEFDGLCSVDQYVYSVNTKEANTNYLAFFMRSPVYLARAPIDTTPGQLPRIRTEEVASVEINLPDLVNQQRISERLNEQMQAVETLKKCLTEELAAIKNLPAALLRNAFAGEL